METTIADKLEELTINDVPTKIITYKGKNKEIPVKNKDPKLCEFFIIARMRYCKFVKLNNSEFCIYHFQDEKKELFINCPIDNSHRVLISKLQRHLKVCNKLEYKNKLQQNVWYTEGINKIDNKIDEGELKELYNLKWEEISEEEYSTTIEKIISCYEILKKDYSTYVENEKLEEDIESRIKDSEFPISISGLKIDLEKDLLSTKNLVKSEKNGKQNAALVNILKLFSLIDSKNTYIEYGAGRGGLSHAICTEMENNSVHILLEREGVRYKKDRFHENSIRVKLQIYFSLGLIFLTLI
jgi:tRNA:m4X modification enzyme